MACSADKDVSFALLLSPPEHIMDLSGESENKTFHIFSQVYGKLAPFSRSSVAELYDNIRR